MASRTDSPTTIVGLFTERSDAEQAISELKTSGFTEDQIGVAMADRDDQKQLMKDTGSTAAEGAATGAMSGGVLGGLIGLLGSLLIPGVGPIVVGGVLASVLTGAGIGAATGGLIGALMGLGVPEEDAKHFDTGLRSGGVLVTVNAGSRGGEAIEILQRNDADLGPSGISRYGSFGDTDTDTSLNAESTDFGTSREGQQRLELKEEELDVSTREKQAGEVRVRKEVVTEKRTVEVPVSREEVVIERHNVSGREGVTGASIGEGEEVRIPLMEEEVDVQKRARVREEISVGKRKVHDTKTVSEDVRHEEARIDSQGDVGIRPVEGQRSRYQGKDRRGGRSAAYSGPERRVGV